jgi:predicted kinase
VPAVAVILDLPPSVVLERNARRPGRVVDEEVVRLHLAQLRAAVDGDRLLGEGFDLVYRIATPVDLDEVTVRRMPATRPVAPPSARAEL